MGNLRGERKTRSEYLSKAMENNAHHDLCAVAAGGNNGWLERPSNEKAKALAKMILRSCHCMRYLYWLEQLPCPRRTSFDDVMFHYFCNASNECTEKSALVFPTESIFLTTCKQIKFLFAFFIALILKNIFLNYFFDVNV